MYDHLNSQQNVYLDLTPEQKNSVPLNISQIEKNNQDTDRFVALRVFMVIFEGYIRVFTNFIIRYVWNDFWDIYLIRDIRYQLITVNQSKCFFILITDKRYREIRLKSILYISLYILKEMSQNRFIYMFLMWS